jgi:hypothetical protein
MPSQFKDQTPLTKIAINTSARPEPIKDIEISVDKCVIIYDINGEQARDVYYSKKYINEKLAKYGIHINR